MLARYPDTAYRAHGNYGIHYSVKLPLYNDSDSEQRIVVRLQTPLQDETLPYGLRFLRNPPNRISFAVLCACNTKPPRGKNKRDTFT